MAVTTLLAMRLASPRVSGRGCRAMCMIVLSLTIAVLAMLAAQASGVVRKSPAKPPLSATAGPVSAFTLPLRGYRGMTVTPALSIGPSHVGRVKITVRVKRTVRVAHHRRRTKWVTRTRFVRRKITSKQEYLVLSGSSHSDLVALSLSGAVKLLSTGLPPGTTAPSEQLSGAPEYASVQVDRRVWLLDDALDPALLYMVGPRNRPVQVASLTGAFTDLIAGPGNNLRAADNSGTIASCAITRRLSVTCTSVSVPSTFAGGQVVALGQAGGRIWVTDNSGELGRLNPFNGVFTGPFGDINQNGQAAGEASSDPHTLASGARSVLYLAGGQESNPLFQNNLILRVNARNGAVTATYKGGLSDVIALTVGADGNIWFVDETNAQTGGGDVGVLNTRSGVLQQYPLPPGYQLPASGAAISPGPVGSNTLFITLQTVRSGQPAFGVISTVQY